jgi:HPt (histidine-containing phosphotransfer) domain-containing protein
MSASGPLDLEALAQLRALPGDKGASLADDAIDAFLRELPTRMHALRAAAAQSDWRTAEHCAQALRGIAHTLGARDVVRIAGELVDALVGVETEQVESRLSELDGAGTVAMAALAQQRSAAP